MTICIMNTKKIWTPVLLGTAMGLMLGTVSLSVEASEAEAFTPEDGARRPIMKQLNEGRKEQAAEFKAQRSEMKEERKMQHKENRDEMKELFADLDEDTKAQLKLLQEDYKEQKTALRESYEDKKDENLHAELEALRTSHHEAVAAVLPADIQAEHETMMEERQAEHEAYYEAKIEQREEHLFATALRVAEKVDDILANMEARVDGDTEKLMLLYTKLSTTLSKKIAKIETNTKLSATAKATKKDIYEAVLLVVEDRKEMLDMDTEGEAEIEEILEMLL